MARKPVATRQREIEAIGLRTEGFAYSEIAIRLGFASKSSAWKAVQRGLDRVEVEEALRLRRLEGLRLDRLQRALWPAAMKGDVKAVQAILRIMERRARMFGLDGEEIDWDAALARAAEDAGLTEPEVVEAVEELMRAHTALKAERGM